MESCVQREHPASWAPEAEEEPSCWPVAVSSLAKEWVWPCRRAPPVSRMALADARCEWPAAPASSAQEERLWPRHEHGFSWEEHPLSSCWQLQPDQQDPKTGWKFSVIRPEGCCSITHICLLWERSGVNTESSSESEEAGDLHFEW